MYHWRSKTILSATSRAHEGTPDVASLAVHVLDRVAQSVRRPSQALYLSAPVSPLDSLPCRPAQIAQKNSDFDSVYSPGTSPGKRMRSKQLFFSLALFSKSSYPTTGDGWLQSIWHDARRMFPHEPRLFFFSGKQVCVRARHLVAAFEQGAEDSNRPCGCSSACKPGAEMDLSLDGTARGVRGNPKDMAMISGRCFHCCQKGLEIIFLKRARSRKGR